MRTVYVAAIAAVAAGGAWWLWSQSDGSGQVEEGRALAIVTMPATLSPEAQAGQQAFAANCASCHGTDAEGRAGTAPPLIHKIYEPGHHGDMAFVMAARNGVRAHHWPFGNMAPVPGLTDPELAGIISFVREVQVANGIR
ncbi:Cytochrome c [Paracoccus chinensis]|uniref:Cytochrome c n=2 Tax=Paracoccus chinensis TaxID=525640 RepID=A0A1G9PCC7_9RHOB|nr:cytochrome c [Paracoccus chinensis]SDL96522.1 Cytochrome c [Paracoccus chinensis]